MTMATHQQSFFGENPDPVRFKTKDKIGILQRALSSSVVLTNTDYSGQVLRAPFGKHGVALSTAEAAMGLNWTSTGLLDY